MESLKDSEQMSEKTNDAPFGDSYGPALMGPFAPVQDESVWSDLEIIGSIPKDLSGVYLRNGPTHVLRRRVDIIRLMVMA